MMPSPSNVFKPNDTILIIVHLQIAFFFLQIPPSCFFISASIKAINPLASMILSKVGCDTTVVLVPVVPVPVPTLSFLHHKKQLNLTKFCHFRNISTIGYLQLVINLPNF
jgi:hypothetical protein